MTPEGMKQKWYCKRQDHEKKKKQQQIARLEEGGKLLDSRNKTILYYHKIKDVYNDNLVSSRKG